MTLYALLKPRSTTELAKYPIMLAQEFPRVSFRRDPAAEELAKLGVVIVTETARPDDRSAAVTELPPELQDGQWVQRWQSVPDSGRLTAAKQAASATITAAGVDDWAARTAVLARKFTDALAAVDAATTGAEIQAALDSINGGRR